MEVNLTSLETLLSEVDQTIQHHEAQARERGEDFNLFSIMGMESNETYTHSAIIAALLDPNGNHYMGSIFLELFLNTVGYDFKDEQLNMTKVITEYYIGKIDKEYERGGYIDILLSFKSGKTLAIENKINARDQPRQLYRYSKFNSEKTNIFYLNLFGHKPHPHSYCTLDLKKVTILSYRKHILEWLGKCLEFCKDGSVLFVSIKQYQILVKKLTNMMDKSEEKALRIAILNNFKAAEYVSQAYQDILFDVRESLRQAIVVDLKKRLPSNKYIVTPGNDSNSNFSQIWIQLVNTLNPQIEFGIESFSAKGNDGGKLFVGILDRTHSNNDLGIKSPDRFYNKWWPVMRTLQTVEGNSVHLNSNALLVKLGDERSEVFQELVNHVSFQIESFVLEHTLLLHNMQNPVIQN